MSWRLLCVGALLTTACTEHPQRRDERQSDDVAEVLADPVTGFSLKGVTAGYWDTHTNYIDAGAKLFSEETGPLPPFKGTFDQAWSNTRSQRVTTGSWETHEYSQLQAFSQDGKYVMLNANGSKIVRRMSDLAVVLDSANTNGGWGQPRWHPTRATKIVHQSAVGGTVRVLLIDVETAAVETAATFPAAYKEVMHNQSYDEISRDGKWLAGMADVSGSPTIFAMNFAENRLGASFTVSSQYGADKRCNSELKNPDWIGVSPLSKYLVVQWARKGAAPCSGMETFDIETGAFVGRVTDHHSHGDMTILDDGTTEVFVTLELEHPDNGNWPSIAYHVLPGTAGPDTFEPAKHVFMTEWEMQHLSCRGPKGVCVVSANWNTKNAGDRALEGEIFLIRLNGSGTLRLGHHHSTASEYWNSSRASISQDGRYVIYASDWGTGVETDASSYVFDLAVNPQGVTKNEGGPRDLGL